MILPPQAILFIPVLPSLCVSALNQLEHVTVHRIPTILLPILKSFKCNELILKVMVRRW
jgi:hypothetical protein